MSNWRKRRCLFFSSLFCRTVIFQNSCATHATLYIFTQPCRTVQEKRKEAAAERCWYLWWINAIMVLLNNKLVTHKLCTNERDCTNEGYTIERYQCISSPFFLGNANVVKINTWLYDYSSSSSSLYLKSLVTKFPIVPAWLLHEQQQV